MNNVGLFVGIGNLRQIDVPEMELASWRQNSDDLLKDLSLIRFLPEVHEGKEGSGGLETAIDKCHVSRVHDNLKGSICCLTQFLCLGVNRNHVFAQELADHTLTPSANIQDSAT